MASEGTVVKFKALCKGCPQLRAAMMKAVPVAMTLYSSLHVQTWGLENVGAAYDLHVRISAECVYGLAPVWFPLIPSRGWRICTMIRMSTFPLSAYMVWLNSGFNYRPDGNGGYVYTIRAIFSNNKTMAQLDTSGP